MYAVPEGFAEELKREFAGRLSIRWSKAERAFVVEQKQGRETTLHLRPAKRHPGMSSPRWTDELLRYEDERYRRKKGLARVCAVSVGDRVPCRRDGCVGVIKVPLGKVVSKACPVCDTPSKPVGFFPLNNWLLEELRRTDPYRGGLERVFADLDKQDAERVRLAARKLKNHTEDVWKDAFTKVFGIESVGYTGKELQ